MRIPNLTGVETRVGCATAIIHETDSHFEGFHSVL